MFKRFGRFMILGGILLVVFMLVASQYKLLEAGSENAPVGDAAPCEGGMAGIYPCDQVDLLSFMGLDELGTMTGARAANVWGWTDPESGIEYVLLGMTDTLAILDISDPLNPVQIGILPNHTMTNPQKYRDVKVYENYAFVIADQFSKHGMQVLDLTQVRDVMTPPVVFSETAYYDGFGDAHNMFINEDTGFAYVARTTDPNNPDPCSGSIYMVDVNDPLNPTFAGCFAEDQGPASDSMCVVYDGPDVAFHGREICLVASDDNIIVGDVTDKAAPAILANLTYPDIHRAHLAWFTEDHQYFVSADMNDEMMMGLDTRIFLWDITQVMSPTLMGYYEGDSPASDHNVWVAGNYAYVGNFRAGVRILNLEDIASTTMTDVTVIEAAYFDMYPADDNTGHEGGAWAAYPYFASGILAASDREAGLFLLQPNLVEPPTDVTLSAITGAGSLPAGTVVMLPALLGALLAIGYIINRKRNSS